VAVNGFEISTESYLCASSVVSIIGTDDEILLDVIVLLVSEDKELTLESAGLEEVVVTEELPELDEDKLEILPFPSQAPKTIVPIDARRKTIFFAFINKCLCVLS